MILPDHLIKDAVLTEHIGITPFSDAQLQPAGYDLTLDRYFRYYTRPVKRFLDDPLVIDVKSPRRMTEMKEVKEWFELGPHAFVLASSIETIRLPNDVMAYCDGKSSLGRLGLAIHVTAGNIDPGFNGTITLELFNVHDFPIRIYPGMPIAQMRFQRLVSPCERDYSDKGGKYQDQGLSEPGPKESEYFRNFDAEG